MCDHPALWRDVRNFGQGNHSGLNYRATRTRSLDQAILVEIIDLFVRIARNERDESR